MKKLLPLVAVLLIGGASNAYAQSADYLSARLISAQTGTALVGPQEAIDMALGIDLKDGWYTYWKMPGDSGLAPVFDWAGSQNIQNVEVLWPAPQRFEEMGLNSFGYKEEVTFPLKITPQESGKDITLNLKAETMVCQNICIPQTLTMMRVFRGGDASVSSEKAEIDMALSKIPVADGTEDLSIDTVVLGKDGVVVTARAKNGWTGTNDVIIETKNGLLTLPPETVDAGSDPSQAIFKVPAPKGMDLPTKLFGHTVNVLVIKDGKAAEKKVTF